MQTLVEMGEMEKNEFKEGQLMVVYDNGMRLPALRVDGVRLDQVKAAGKWYHFKQCRLLEKVKPREFYVKREDISILFSGGDTLLNSVARLSEQDIVAGRESFEEYVKVREILGEEE